MKIYKLSNEVSNLIAAGEVVENPLSIVKELVENAVDANSTTIEIKLVSSGIDKIEIIDNGEGMSNEDALTSVLRHATSKIKTKQDLFNISSLGFRGEALASIASVSKFSIITNDSLESTKLYFEAGKLIENINFPANKGTHIIVENMFYNTPVRLKFLKSEAFELSQIVDFIQKISLSYQNIKFKLTNNNKVLLNTTASNNYSKTISEVYSEDLASNIKEISFSDYNYNIDLYYSKPEFTRSSKNYITILVNNRVVKNYKISAALVRAYKDKLFSKRFPVIILKITVDPILIDVNVHPSKQEVKLSKEQDLIDLIERNLNDALFNSTSEYEFINKNTNNVLYDDDYKKFINREDYSKIISEDNSYLNELTKENIETSKEVVVEKFDLFDELFEDKVTFPILDYIGQVFSTYLLFQSTDSFYLIDQHAAAERINYEIILENLNIKSKEYYDLLVPLELAYSKSDIIKIENSLDEFLEYGIKIEHLSVDTLIVRSVPLWFRKGYELDYIDELVKKVISNKTNETNEDLAASIACKKSIKAKTYVTKEEVDTLIQSLKKCNNPYNCPHGRPTMIKYSKYELDRMFKRT